MKGESGGVTFSSDDVVLKSPNDRRLYRLIHLSNGLQALLVHDPEIYPQGPPPEPQHEDDEEEEEDEDEEEDDEEEEEEEGDEDNEDEMDVDGAKDAAQTKKVGFFFFWVWYAAIFNVLSLW